MLEEKQIIHLADKAYYEVFFEKLKEEMHYQSKYPEFDLYDTMQADLIAAWKYIKERNKDDEQTR